MNFAAFISERDKGAKVIDFQIQNEQVEEASTFITKLEQLVADLKRRGQTSDSNQQGVTADGCANDEG
jgi:hypothetical protein